MDSLELTKIIQKVASDKKATRILAFDLRDQSDLCQYMVVCSGSNDTQTKAIAQAIEETCRSKYGIKPLAVEGKQSGHWILLDYGYLIVHVFFDYIRNYYAIEKLWPNAKLIK